MSSARKVRPSAAPPVRRPGKEGASFVRIVLLAALAIIGACWGLVRHYAETPPPMLVPVRSPPAATYDLEAGELPVPDTIETDAP